MQLLSLYGRKRMLNERLGRNTMRFMEIRDTNPESEKLVRRLYKQMSAGEKLLRVFSAYRTGQALVLAGLAMRYPQASEEQLQMLWKRQHLGAALFMEIYGRQAAEKLPD